MPLPALRRAAAPAAIAAALALAPFALSAQNSGQTTTSWQDDT